MAFSIESKLEYGFNAIILKDNSTQTSITIIPDCGAILHAFNVLNNNLFLNIIDNYTDVNDFVNNVESKGFKSCKLSPFACRIKNARYVFEGIEYTVSKFLIDGNALHGLLYNVPFMVTFQEAGQYYAKVVLTHQYRGGVSGYPFHYDCVITYTLLNNNKLSISTTILNQDKVSIPVQDGWHPYFTFGDKINDLQLTFKSKEKFVFDNNLVPTGELVEYGDYSTPTTIGDAELDDCFLINFKEDEPVCVLTDPVNKIALSIEAEKNYPYLQLYTPPHRNSIAIENLSAIPNAFNNGIGLIILAPLSTKTFTTSYQITSLI